MIETGWVYVITNESMPGLVKVGVTKNRPEHRAKELDETGSPTPYKVETAFLFSKAAERIEKKGHALLADVRVRGNREWFKASPKYAALKILDASFHVGSEIFKIEPKLSIPEEMADLERQIQGWKGFSEEIALGKKEQEQIIREREMGQED
ncbi:GIY-YIG nuclease family protein [Akkermansiaceae bacterium]|nr:GIY-YIG nuclease family protein [Akkermansiaceae bacterium]MDC0305232.1 GIY-YIG nuclease family protein [bacterium]